MSILSLKKKSCSFCQSFLLFFMVFIFFFFDLCYFPLSSYLVIVFLVPWVVKLFICDLSIFFNICIFSTINFPQRLFLQLPTGFGVLRLKLPICFKFVFFLIYLLITSLTHWFRNVLFGFHMIPKFPALLLLISKFMIFGIL